MEEFTWRYRLTRQGPLSQPVTVRLTDREADWMRSLSARARALPEGPERSARLNEITTFMDLRAVFPDASIDVHLRSLPDPGTNRVGKFSGPAAQAPATQRAAALLVYPRTGTARRRTLDYIAGHHDATDERMAAALSLPLNTIRPRRNELMNDGWIRDSGRVLATGTGTDAVVWELTAAGREQYG